mmetsp:Transcript_24422/g.44502  ORF Transcript_24422/g.44502 Transcript_24422/m.44502 type:complete len:234 (-) Transcript_24422:176-877(-)
MSRSTSHSLPIKSTSTNPSLNRWLPVAVAAAIVAIVVVCCCCCCCCPVPAAPSLPRRLRSTDELCLPQSTVDERDPEVDRERLDSAGPAFVDMGDVIVSRRPTPLCSAWSSEPLSAAPLLSTSDDDGEDEDEDEFFHCWWCFALFANSCVRWDVMASVDWRNNSVTPAKNASSSLEVNRKAANSSWTRWFPPLSNSTASPNAAYRRFLGMNRPTARPTNFTTASPTPSEFNRS